MGRPSKLQRAIDEVKKNINECRERQQRIECDIRSMESTLAVLEKIKNDIGSKKKQLTKVVNE